MSTPSTDVWYTIQSRKAWLFLWPISLLFIFCSYLTTTLQMTCSNDIYSNSKCRRYLNCSILFFFLDIGWWKLQCMHLIIKTVVMIHVFETIKYLIVLCKRLCTVTNKHSLVFDNYNIWVPLHAIPSWQAFISLATYMYGTIKWSLWHY